MAYFVAHFQDPSHTPTPLISILIHNGVPTSTDLLIHEFCHSLELLLGNFEGLWEPEASGVAPRCLAYFRLIMSASSENPRSAWCFLHFGALLLSLSFHAGYVPGGQNWTSSWGLAHDAERHLSSLSEDSSATNFASLTKFLRLLHSHSFMLQPEQASTATAHAFIMLCHLPGIVTLASDDDDVLRALHRVLYSSPPSRYPPADYNVSPYPFTRLVFATLSLKIGRAHV